MQHEASLAPDTAPKGLSALPQYWRAPLVRLGLALLAVLALSFTDWAAMADQWWNVSTYNHILFVPFISGWLIWQRRAQLAQIQPLAWWPGLILLAGAMFLWLLGSLVSINSASQLGAVLAMLACCVTILGLRVSFACAFPLAYLLFLVPFGDELVPSLQMITADLVILFTRWSQIPAVIDGVFIDTPVGLFEVAEACSGVKFLIAMIAMGVLVSYACFQSWIRRAIFMAMAVLVPIVANGIRAWGTIYIAQSQGVEFAEGFDHIFYGWIFFAIVMLILFAGAWKWFDRDPESLGVDFPNAVQTNWFKWLEQFSLAGKLILPATVAVLASFGLWHGFASKLEADLPASIAAPMVPGWQQTAYQPPIEWEPRASGADHRFLVRYQNQNGDHVDVFVALYGAQEDGREAAAAGEGALVPDSAWRWLAPSNPSADAIGAIYLANGRYKRLTETSYRTGAIFTGSPAKLKLANMRDRLMLNEAMTMTLILSTDIPDEQRAAATIAEFRQAIGNEGIWLDQIAGLR